MAVPLEKTPETSAWQPSLAVVPFLEGLYELEAAGNTRKAVDQVIDYLDDLLNEGKFAECDDLLRQVNVDKASSKLIIAFLGITRAASGKLPGRLTLCNTARKKLTAELGPERAVRLMNKYE